MKKLLAKEKKTKSANKETQPYTPPPGLPPIVISTVVASGRYLFYPEDDFSMRLLNVLRVRRKAYVKEEIQGLKDMGFPIKVVAKKIEEPSWE